MVEINKSIKDALASLGASSSELDEFAGLDAADMEAESKELISLESTDELDDDLVLSPIEKKALSLLGSGCNSEQVASALGVTPSTISGFLSQKHFRDKVTNLRFINLRKHSDRDDKYDTIEDKLLKRLENNLHLIHKPETLLNAIKTVNSAKRRGGTVVNNIAAAAKVTQLILPTTIVQHFTVNSNNQVIQAGNQTLITMEAKNLDKLVEAKQQADFIESEEASKLINNFGEQEYVRSEGA